MKISVVGVLNVGKDVTPEHIQKAVESVRVYGILRASPRVKEALRARKKGGY